MSKEEQQRDESPRRPRIENLEKKLESLIQGLVNESDLICAIIGASYVDLALNTLLKEHFISSGTSDNLLDPNGALDSMKAKGDLAYCLGLLPKSVVDSLSSYGRIRNEFAHKLDVTFGSKEVIKKCNDLTFPITELRFASHGGSVSGSVKISTTSPREKFTLVTGLLAFIILNAAQDVKRCVKMEDDEITNINITTDVVVHHHDTTVDHKSPA